MTAHMPRALPLILATLAAFAFVMGVSGLEQITDPFIRNDDFPAYLRRGDLFYAKTLQEGRWINYWWHLRPIHTPAWLNYAVFMLGSALFAAALSLHALGARKLWLTALTAALIAVSPQSTLISAWFNTLIPGIWITAAYAVITLWTSPVTGRWLLFLFIPLTLVAYSTYPLLLLLVCLTRADARRTLGEYLHTMTTFVAAFAFGMVAMYALNWAVHGVFGLSYANWRSATPAHDLAGYIANIPLLIDFHAWALSGLGFGMTWLGIVNVAAFLTALAIIARRHPVEALALLTGALTGIALLSLLTLKDGVHIFFRSTQFTWAAYGVTLARAYMVLRENGSPRANTIAVGMAVLTIVSGLLAARVYTTLDPFQRETRRIAALIPETASEIRIYGHYADLPEAVTANVQDESGLRFRLEDLTGVETVYCEKTPERCPGTPPFGPPAPGDPLLIESDDTITFLRLPGRQR